MNADVNSDTISYEDSKELARHADPVIRATLARRTDVRPEVLYFLAQDDDSEVRRIVAENDSAPSQSDVLLAKDNDGAVRSGLAGKIARVAPELSGAELDRARKSTYDALEILAKDQLKVVRQVLSDTLKDVTDAPADIIRILARDVEIDISGPVLEYSPVLTEADLIDFINAGPISGAANAIARRDGLQSTVADAIVATDDIAAIADLLGNGSAQIREETLNDLIDRAPGIALWHKPLVARPALPEGAAGRMAKFLAGNLIQELRKRSDLDAESLSKVASIVGQRFGGDALDFAGTPAKPGQDFLAIDPPRDALIGMRNANKLTLDVIHKAMMVSDHTFVFAALLVLADIETDVGRRIFQEKNAKGILALCWKAGFPAKQAVQVQQRMGRLSPEELIEAGEDGQYPLDDSELEWQLRFFRDLAMGGA